MPTLVITAGALTGWRIEVDRLLTVGRTHADVVLQDPRVSRRHAGFRPLGDGTIEAADLRSSNGTWVNGQRITRPTLVRPGDTVQLGDTPMTCSPTAGEVWEWHEEERPTAPPPSPTAPAPAAHRPPVPVAAFAGPAASASPAFALSGPAARGAFRPHWGLRTRMLLTMLLLFLLYAGALVGAALGGGFYWLIAGVAVIFALVQTLAADKIALASVGARVVPPEEAPELHGIVDRLCIQAGTPKPRVAIADTPVPNALAVGRSRKRATVVVTTGLMKLLTPTEMEGVVAHELAHIRNRDVMVMTIAGFLMIAAAFCMALAKLSIRVFAGVILIGFLVWALSKLLVQALSRYREFVADRDAALVTGRPSALASALLKVSGENARIPDKDLRELSGMSAFMFASPTKFQYESSHPPVQKRVDALHALEREIQGT